MPTTHPAQPDDRAHLPTAPQHVQQEPAAGGPAVLRRRLLQGAGVLAGAAGATALLGAAPDAQAADGARLALGRTNEAVTTTTLRPGGRTGSEDPTLSLRNVSGPTLHLEPRPDEFRGDLEVGQIINQTTGSVIGVDNGDGPENTFVALGSDLAQIPVPFAFSPVRMLDTRRPPLSYVVGSSAHAFDAADRLLVGGVDLGVLAAAEIFSAQVVFLSVTVTQPEASGHLTMGPPGPRPPTSTVNFSRGQTVASGGFFSVGVVGDSFAARVHTSATTHVVVDITGYTLVPQPGPLASAAARRAARVTRVPLPAATAHRTLGRKAAER